MRPWKKPFAVIALCGATILAWVVGTELLQSAQYARAAQEVNAAREQLATVQDLANVFKMVGKVVEPSVVKIEVHKTNRTGDRMQDFLKQFFPDNDGDGEPDVPEEYQDRFRGPDFEAFGTGSGVIVEADRNVAYVVTNNHVAGDASEMTVTLSDGREIRGAKLVGADPKTDLAVVRIEAEGIIAAKWGDSDYLEKGELICAFGSPFGYVGSMTHGIVSALNRDRVGIIGGQYAYENFIQVDAPINPGNSGGPLVNLRGEVVGINTAIASRTGGFTGIGFAIPSNQAKFVYEQIRQQGRVVRGWLGVEIIDVAAVKEEVRNFDGKSGVYVRGVVHDSPSLGKLELGDVVVGINGRKIERMSELRNIVAATSPGTELKMDVVRNGEKMQIGVTLGEQPDEPTVMAANQRNGSRPRTLQQFGMMLARPTEQMLRDAGITEVSQGALVTAITRGSPAALSGFQRGDLITKIDETPITSPQDASTALSKADLSKGVRVHVVNRQGKRLLFLKTND